MKFIVVFYNNDKTNKQNPYYISVLINKSEWNSEIKH